MATYLMWLIPALALAVVNVNVKIVDAAGKAMNVSEVMFNPGADDQRRARNRDGDHTVMGIPLNDGDRVPVEVTTTDGKKFTGTLVVPHGKGKPEVNAQVTVFPKGAAKKSQAQTDTTKRKARKKKAKKKKAAKKKVAKKKKASKKKTARKKSRYRTKGGTATTVSQVELEKIPTARDPWSVLTQTPGVIVDRINTGGNESGQQSNFTGRGGSDDSVWQVDGVVITDMAAIGASPTYYNFDAFEEMQFTTGGTDVGANAGGVRINLVTKRGTNEWRGSGRYIADTNIWAFTEQATPQQAPGKPINDYSFEYGGPIIKDKLWVWANYGRNELDLSTIQDLSDFTKLEDYGGKLNAQLSNPNFGVGMINYGDAIKTGRGAAPTRPQDTTWNQRGPTDIWKLEDTHVFNSNFYLTGLAAYVGGGFQLVPSKSLSDLGTTDGSRGFFNDWPSGASTRPAEQYRIDGSYFFNTGNVSHELRFGSDYRDVNIDVNNFSFKNKYDWYQSVQFTGGNCFPTSQGGICGGGPGREMEQDKPAQPPQQFMLQSPADFTLEHSARNFGEGQGPILVKGNGVKMLNYAWVFPGNWQTDVVMGPEQHRVAETAPTWLGADHALMVDDSIAAQAMATNNSAAFAKQLWQLAQTKPTRCEPRFGGADHAARGWMLLRATSSAGVQHFALQLRGGRSGWIELDAKGQPKLFGYALRYDPVSHLLWLVAGTTHLNKELVYSIDLGELARSWASLTDSGRGFDAKTNPLRICGTGEVVKAPAVKPASAKKTAAKTKVKVAKSKNPVVPAKIAKLNACPDIKTRVPAKVLTLALKSPATVTGAGYLCRVNAPPISGNPVRTNVSLRDPKQAYHPLFNPLQASCTCKS